jgi:hypothetical protein
MESDAMPNLVLAIFRALLHEGPMPLKRLLQIIAPESVISDPKRARSSRLRLTQLGLFEESDEDVVRISTEIALPRDRAKAEALLPQIITRLAFAPQNNANFWDAEKSASADFTRGVAWMLAQNVYNSVFVANHQAEAVENSQLGGTDRSLFRNNTRWNGFKSWAPFLGFGTLETVSGDKAFLIDPTVAVRNNLDAVFTEASELPISEFVDRLAEKLPVLDRGSYRTEVESQLNPRHWEPLKEREISTSLSRALIRLREARLLRLPNRADSPTRMEMLLQGKRKLAVTHIIRDGATP